MICISPNSELYHLIPSRIVNNESSFALCSCNYKQYPKSVMHVNVCYKLVCDMVKDWMGFVCQTFMTF